MRGRDYVLPEDVSLVFGDVVPHQSLLSPVRRPTAPSTPLRSRWSGCPPPDLLTPWRTVGLPTRPCWAGQCSFRSCSAFTCPPSPWRWCCCSPCCRCC
ncbi:MAG: hypothetical protein ACLRNQ_15035 [Flavonifractor plautii]